MANRCLKLTAYKKKKKKKEAEATGGEWC